MILQELQIRAFGKYKDKTMYLREGLNLITGPNESGKTTIHAFIQGMLFGLRRQRGRASRRDIYSRYLPWEEDGRYGGVLRFSCEGKLFRLTRNFRGERLLELVCETDGERLNPEKGDLDILLGDIGEAVFENTLSVGQMRSIPTEGLRDALKNKMANYRDGSWGTTDIQGAIGDLKRSQRELEKEKKNREQIVKKQLEGASIKLERLQQERESLQAEMELLSEKILLHEKLGKRASEAEGTERSRLPAFFGVLFIVLLFYFLSFFINLVPLTIIAVTVLVGCLLFVRKIQNRDISDDQEEIIAEEIREQKDIWERENLSNRLEEKELEIEHQRQVLEEIKLQLYDVQESDQEIRAVSLAWQTITELANQRRGLLGEKLNKRTSEIFSAITGGEYGGVHITETLEIGIDTGETYVEPERLSRGTLEQLYLAYRLAAGELLCSEEKLPILLDDTFVMYDDERLRQVLDWLSNCGQQVLIFSCQRREEKILKTWNIPFHKIELENNRQ